ncbi:MAG: hypothetical protein QMD80_06815 [archaeon]|nr:hypothetical protein [archaeon]
MIIEELKYSHNDTFIELAVKIIYDSKIDCSSDLLSLISLPIKNAYALSSVCLLLGMIGPKDAIKPLWDCYHFFKEMYPHESYAQGPLIGLYELNSKGSGSIT